MRMEECLLATAEGRSRKERESARREAELTKALEAEDGKLQKEKELIDRNARDAAIASSSTSAPGMGEQAMVEHQAGVFAVCFSLRAITTQLQLLKLKYTVMP